MKVIVDADPGTDDAAAILLLLKDPSVELLAITVTQGNTKLGNATRNAMRILSMAGRNNIPVYAGSKHSILGHKVKMDFYFGLDGMGDMETEYDKSIGKVEREHAVTALIRLAAKHKGEITLLCIGPVTNAALAVQIDTKFGANLKECFIMGGNYAGQGNITPAAEFNFFRDPEAAQILFKYLTCPITLITWELCLSLQLEWDWYDKIMGKGTKTANFLKAAGALMAKKAKESGLKNYVLADELAAACLIKKDLYLETVEVGCRVELSGELTRGQVVVDWSSASSPCGAGKVKIVKKINVQMFKDMMEYLTSS